MTPSVSSQKVDLDAGGPRERRGSVKLDGAAVWVRALCPLRPPGTSANGCRRVGAGGCTAQGPGAGAAAWAWVRAVSGQCTGDEQALSQRFRVWGGVSGSVR